MQYSDLFFPMKTTQVSIRRDNMVAGLETRIKDGVKFATFASYKKPGWHALGTVFEEPKTSSEILEVANMAGWNLHCKTVELYLGSKKIKPME